MWGVCVLEDVILTSRHRLPSFRDPNEDTFRHEVLVQNHHWNYILEHQNQLFLRTRQWRREALIFENTCILTACSNRVLRDYHPTTDFRRIPDPSFFFLKKKESETFWERKSSRVNLGICSSSGSWCFLSDNVQNNAIKSSFFEGTNFLNFQFFWEFNGNLLFSFYTPISGAKHGASQGLRCAIWGMQKGAGFYE